MCKGFQSVWQTNLNSICFLVGGNIRPLVTQMDAVMMIKLLLVSEPAKMLVYSFSSNRLNAAAKQMEKIAVTQGPIAFSSATVPAFPLRRRPAVETVWEVERKLQLPCESHTITQGESKEEHFGRTKGKRERKREWRKKWNQLSGSASSLQRCGGACS